MESCGSGLADLPGFGLRFQAQLGCERVVLARELTLKEIGEVLSLTESRICQIHTAILIKLKSRLEAYELKP